MQSLFPQMQFMTADMIRVMIVLFLLALFCVFAIVCEPLRAEKPPAARDDYQQQAIDHLQAIYDRDDMVFWQCIDCKLHFTEPSWTDVGHLDANTGYLKKNHAHAAVCPFCMGTNVKSPRPHYE